MRIRWRDFELPSKVLHDEETATEIRIRGGVLEEQNETGGPTGTLVEVEGQQVEARQEIPYGHKIALADIPAGSTVLKYGLSIGNATQEIRRGDHVHIHNVESNRGRGDLADNQGAQEAASE